MPRGGGKKGFLKGAVTSKQAEDLEAGPKTAVAQPPADPDGQQTARPVAAERAAKQTAETASDAVKQSGGEPETRGQLQQRHKKERKQLNEKTKKLGKKRKDEAASMEAELQQRQDAEFAALEAVEAANAPQEQPAQAADPAAKFLPSQNDEDDDWKPVQTKAQKRKEKAAAQEAAREARIAAENEAAGESERVMEERGLEELLLPLGLAIRSIPADGHCLYRAVDDQLAASRAAASAHDAEDSADGGSLQNGDAERDEISGYKKLRHAAAKWMREHPDDFMPFIAQEELNPEDGGRQAAFSRYCNEVADTAAWGGELELTALAHALQRHMLVHSVGMQAVEIGPDYEGGLHTLQLCYLRHAFGLGEHYNSVSPLTAAH